MHYRIIVFFAFLISSVSSGAQIDSAVKEMRWKITTLLMQDRDWYNDKISPSFLSGVGVKYRTKYLTLRAGFEHYGYHENDNETRFKIGVEKGILILNRIRPYLAAEAYGVYKHSDILDLNYRADSYRYEETEIGVGGMYSLGIEGIISKYISLSVETRLLHQSVKREYKNTNLTSGYVSERSGYKNNRLVESLGMVCLEIRLP
ncbi:hypothetical protein [Salibacter sp.]|uniref:hypothetical protein n=1 Tax=Salibacter sp. TaxID=2010995 RepID=UPI00286FD57E|nr:hypothetical protein [Salibacter sp.]MDR9398304.1 hypothetical protein [Salibacter sp.]MDR9487685.1 hypothetical protein [Salibacter sp.]